MFNSDDKTILFFYCGIVTIVAIFIFCLLVCRHLERMAVIATIEKIACPDAKKIEMLKGVIGDKTVKEQQSSEK